MAKIFSPRAEAQAIRALCAKDPKISGLMLGNLNQTFFHSKAAIEVYKRIQKFNERKGTVPAISVVREDLGLSDDAKAFIDSEVKAPRSSEDAEQLIGVLDKYRRTRVMYSMCKEVINDLTGTAVDIDALQEFVVNKLTEIQTRRTTEADVIHIGKDGNALEKIKSILFDEGTEQVIPTGFRDFDTVNGGFFRGSLQAIGANTGGGKSLLTNQLCINQAKLGYKIVLVPLEMSLDQMLSRTMSSTTGYNSIDIFLKRLATGEKEDAFKKMRRMNREIEGRGGRYTVFKPREDMTIEQLLASVHSYNADVIYIDYLNLLAGVSDSEDSWRKLGNAARHAKIYAENHNKVIVLLTQVNDEGQVRYSKAVVEHCNGFWTFVTTKESREAGYMNIVPIKSRNQVPDPFTLKVDFAKMQVTDLNEADRSKMNRDYASKKTDVNGNNQDGERFRRKRPPVTDQPKRDQADLTGV